MVDVVSKSVRSRMMSAIKGKNTKPEINLRKALHAMGLRYRIHAGHLPGKPDLIFPKHNAVVLVNGCFWHRHLKCKYAYIPKSRVEFWETKFRENVKRDRKNKDSLKRLGWRVAVVWECSLHQAILRF
jgi:DNA mismatch endonuclease, patch repair protein